MSNLQTYIDPNSTNQILKNLGFAIDEAKLVLKLNKLNNEIYELESLNGVSERSADLRREITIVKVQLNYLRECFTSNSN